MPLLPTTHYAVAGQLCNPIWQTQPESGAGPKTQGLVITGLSPIAPLWLQHTSMSLMDPENPALVKSGWSHQVRSPR